MAHISSEEQSHIVRQANTAWANGRNNEAVNLIKKIPLLPEEARAAKEVFGAEWLRESGFNLSAAEEAYGKDWLHQ